MSNRTYLLLGLLMALPAAMPTLAQAADGKPAQWSAGGAAAASGSAEEAAQLARQAAELAARAAQMAAAAQNQNGTPSATASAPATATSGVARGTLASSFAPVTSAAAAAAPTTIANNVQQPNVVEIRFQNSPAAASAPPSASVGNLPAITPPTMTVSAPSAIAVPNVPAQSAIHDDSQVQLAATSYLDGKLLRAAQEEPLPAAPGSPQPAPLSTNMYDNGAYSTCNDGCCPPQRVLFWTGGVEATFLTPDVNNDGVFFEVEQLNADRFDVFSSEASDVDSLYVSPRAWVGIQGCRWGANLRYWHLQASEGQYDPSLGSLNAWDAFDCGVPDVGFFTCSRLEAYTVDLELTRRFCINDCWMQASFGVRHANIEANQSITGLALTDDGLLAGYARANRQSRGTGLLFGLYGRKPVFPCSCVSWFYNFRYSTLWGPTETSAESFASVQANDPDFTASAASVNGAYTVVDDTLFIGEVQLGLEWNYALQCIPANTFCRFAIEYQRWDGGNGFSAANSFAGITLDGDVSSNSIVSTSGVAQEPQMDLFGFAFSAGITW
jgi:hypothetical protein